MGGGEFPSESSEVRTVVLIGRAGNGKSATGNSIIGKREFKSKCSLNGVTRTCQLERKKFENGLTLKVIDTPGLFDFSSKTEYIGEEIVKCINMAKDGIHAFLVVLSIRNRFSEEEEASINYLIKFFGDKIRQYMILVITSGDELEENDETLEEYLCDECPEPFKKILGMCENRCVLFDNKTGDNVKRQEQLQKLIMLVEMVGDKNDGKPYTNELFSEVIKGSTKLHDQITDSNSSNEYSKEMHNELKQLIKMVELKLRETCYKLELQLAEEKNARLTAEATADKEIQRLKESLERAKRETDELRKSKGYCPIM